MPKRHRSGPHYAYASDRTLASAGGYRSGITGHVYTRDILQQKASTNGFVDYNITQNMSSDGAGRVHLIATIPQGTSTQTRIGRKCQLKAVQFRGHVRCSAHAAADDAQCCIVLVYDKRPTGILPTANQILESSDPLALNKEDGFDRYKICKRWDFAIMGNRSAPTTGSMGARSNKQLMAYKSFGKKGLNARYTTNAAGIAGTIAGITEGALYLVVLSSEVFASTYGPDLELKMRIKFQDLLS